jgi:hypothetical protein
LEIPADISHTTQKLVVVQFQTAPLPKNLGPFVGTILSACEPLRSSRVILEQIVFQPKHLTELGAKYSISMDLRKDTTIDAPNKAESEALLLAALSDWVDFAFVPNPKPFIIYADHDEYTTFFANTKANLNRVLTRLGERGFKAVTDYTRHF